MSDVTPEGVAVDEAPERDDRFVGVDPIYQNFAYDEPLEGDGDDEDEMATRVKENEEALRSVVDTADERDFNEWAETDSVEGMRMRIIEERNADVPGHGPNAEGSAASKSRSKSQSDEPDSDMPVRSASKSDWVAYAVDQGVSEEDADDMTRDELADEYRPSS